MRRYFGRTWRRYAFSLVVWLDFLETRARSWDAATRAHFDGFKHWRMTDHRNPQRVRATSFDTDRAALNLFYDWAARYGVANPVPTRGSPRTRATRLGELGAGIRCDRRGHRGGR